jgi:hypothetical protein
VHSIPDFCNPAAISSFETSLLPAHQSTAQHRAAYPRIQQQYYASHNRAPESLGRRCISVPKCTGF